MSRTKQSAIGHVRKNLASRQTGLMKIASHFLLIVFMAGGGYLFSVNQNAVKGYQLRTLEKEITALKEKNTKLKIAEADLRSLYRIEAEGNGLDMQKLEGVKYIDEPSPLALSGNKNSLKLLTLVSPDE